MLENSQGMIQSNLVYFDSSTDSCFFCFRWSVSTANLNPYLSFVTWPSCMLKYPLRICKSCKTFSRAVRVWNHSSWWWFLLHLLTLFSNSLLIYFFLWLWLYLQELSGSIKKKEEVSFSSLVPWCLRSCLERVEMRRPIYGVELEMKLIKYLLENSTVLKKLTLRLGCPRMQQESIVFMELLRFRRCSTECEVDVVGLEETLMKLWFRRICVDMEPCSVSV